jgi:excisionase family DNA binding protein
MAIIEGEILTLEELAAYLKAGKRTVYRLASNGQIPAFKLGGTWRFRKADLERWIADQTGKAALDEERAGKGAATVTFPAAGQRQPVRSKRRG